MNETVELLQYIYQNSEMGVYTLTKLINELNEKENKIKRLVQEQLNEYEKYKKESKKLIEKTKEKLKGTKLSSKMGASMGIKMEVLKDNSDASIAHMLTEGITMGVVDIETKIKNYKDIANKKVIQLANNYLIFQQNQINDLKEYL